MTIEEFMNNNEVKLRSTVIGWIRKGYIPRANEGENYIPNSARVPYINAKARTSDAIYNSIVEASRQRKHVMPALYRMGDDEFQGYINRLVEAGFIVIRISDGVTYYDATLKAKNANKNFILKVIKALAEGTSYGATKAMLDNFN